MNRNVRALDYQIVSPLTWYIKFISAKFSNTSLNVRLEYFLNLTSGKKETTILDGKMTSVIRETVL